MENRSFRIRKVGISDYSACLPLLVSLYHGDIGKDFEKTFRDYTRSGLVLLVEHFDKVVGILMGSYHLDIDWEGITAKTDAVIVDKEYRRKGVGKKLMYHFITIAQSEHCKAIKSRINIKNAVAQKFHERLGFTKAETYEYFLDFQETIVS